jgi:origin recognition complex subunit 2
MPSLPLPLHAGCGQRAARRGAATVLSTLVPTARDVFRLIAGLQLDAEAAAGSAAANKNNSSSNNNNHSSSSGGVGFPALLRLARERFVLNSEAALKSILAEFRDHELVRLRPGPDGADVMFIPFEPDALQETLAELDAAEAAARGA